MEDRLAELQARTYGSGTIAAQLKDFVGIFPELDQGERKLWIDPLVEWVEVGQNKRVTACLRPPLDFGFLSPELAPRGGKPQTGRSFVIRIAYTLTPYYRGINGACAVIGSGFKETAAPAVGAGSGQVFS